MRLGAQLVEDGLVSQDAVAQALKEQAVNGGRLGTNLIEIEAIGIDALSKALSRQHGCSEARVEHFESRDERLVAGLEVSVAARLSVVPLYLSGENADTVVVASMDPATDPLVDMLSEILKRPVILGIAPELRILYWLERAYGIGRTNRFKRWETQGTGHSSLQERRGLITTLADESPPEPQSALAKIAVRRVTVRVKTEDIVRDPPKGIEGLTRAIRRSNDRREIGSLVTAALREEFGERIQTGVLLMCRKEIALGWLGFIRGQRDLSRIETIALPLTEPSMLHGVYSNQSAHTQGPIAEPSTLDLRLRELLETRAPVDMAALPIVIEKRVVALLYIESSQKLTDDDWVNLRALSAAVSSGFKRLIRASQR